MPNPELVKSGPFVGVNLSAEPAYLPEGAGALASNVDISYRYGAFSSANGRSLLASIAIPTGYNIQGITELTSFYGENPPKAKRIFVFSAMNSLGASYQGYYDPDTSVTTQLVAASPFTSAVQFGSSVWTDGGDRIFYFAGTVVSDEWQIQVPYAYAFNVNGTYKVSAGNAPLDTYTYAITLRRAFYWSISGAVVPKTYIPDPESFQESSPVFSTTVTTTAGQQPGIAVSASTPGLSKLIGGVTIGGEQYFGCLYRSRTNAPTFVFVDYLANLTVTTDHAGNAMILDVASEADIANNQYLIFHHDPPPIIGQTYPGAIANNSSVSDLQKQQQQVAFTYKNPAFLTKHKGRLWAFTLYPAEAIGTSPTTNPDEITLQPQVWASDYGTPWSFNDDAAQNQVLLVGLDDSPGNGNIDAGIATNPPWKIGILEDTPMGLESTGSYLVLLKSQRVYIAIGQTPSEFEVSEGFDIGCISVKSVTRGEGGIFWEAAQGAYFFNGGAPDYISEDVRGFIESLPWSVRQASVGGYKNKTFYLSYPIITQVVAPTITPGSADGSNSGTASITANAGRQTVNESAGTATASVHCSVTLHKPDPRDPDTWFTTYLCSENADTPATWAVTVGIAPIDVTHQLTFNPTTITGTDLVNAPATLSLLKPDGTLAHDFGDITQGTEYDYHDAAATVGTYTWKVEVDVSTLVGSDESSSPAGTYSVTVTPTVTFISGSTVTANGPITTIVANSATAPQTTSTELTLALSGVVTPSDVNGSTAYTVILKDHTGFAWVTRTGITADQTITFSNSGTPAGDYTWTVQAILTAGTGNGSSSYAVSASLHATWFESSGEVDAFSGTTLAYYIPAKKWYTLPYGGVLSYGSPFDKNKLVFVNGADLQLVADNPATDLGQPIVATWQSDISDGGAPSQLKSYEYIQMKAPIGKGLVTVTLTLDSEAAITNTQTVTFDLSKGNGVHVSDLNSKMKGYQAQLTITATTDPAATEPLVIRSVSALGNVTAGMKNPPVTAGSLIQVTLNGAQTYPKVP